MKLLLFFMVMATVVAGVDRFLSRINRNEGDFYGN